MVLLRLALATFVSLLFIGCPQYDGPPQAAIVGLEDGLLADPTAPLTIAFHEPIEEDSLNVKIVRYQTDPEGELLPDDQLDILYESDPTALILLGELDDSGKYFTISLTETLPIGPQLAVVIEPGLADREGNSWKVPRILKFGYQFDCGAEEDREPTGLPSSVLFLLADVEQPLKTQLQLMVDVRVDPETGDWIGQFTNADRDTSLDCTPYGLSCAETEVCRTLPEPACVVPSERAASVSEHPDFYPNDELPAGYSFTGIGCARDVGEGRFAFSSAPTDVKVHSPNITVKGIAFNLEVGFNEAGLLEGGGTFTALEVFLGDAPSGAGEGTGVLVEIPIDEIPEGLPAPPAAPGEPLE